MQTAANNKVNAAFIKKYGSAGTIAEHEIVERNTERSACSRCRISLTC